MKDEKLSALVGWLEDMQGSIATILDDLSVEKQPEVGSAEWALEQMKAGESVTCSNELRYWVEGDRVYCGSRNNIACMVNAFVEWYSGCGWQLYTPKPLLQDAKVGDYAETRDGNIVKIEETDNKKRGFPIVYVGGIQISLSGRWCLDQKDTNHYDIIRLIPQNTPEWRELETAELLRQYPNIERKLETVQEGDTVLFSDGNRFVVERTDHNSLWIPSGSIPSVDKNYREYCGFMFCNGERYQSIPHCKVTCLGIIKRAAKQYTTLKIVQMMESGEVMMASSKSLNLTITVNEVSKKINGVHIRLSSTLLATTDWVVEE